MKEKIETVASAGVESGRTMRAKTVR